MITSGFGVLAVGGGVVVIVVAVCVVLIVLLVTLAMRGHAKQSALRRGEPRRDLDAERERGLAAGHESADARDSAVNRVQDTLEHMRERDDA